MFARLLFRTYARKREREVKWSLAIQHYCQAVANDARMISLPQLKQSFKLNNLPISNGYTCITVDCPICNQTKKRSKLYVNKMTGYFICNCCNCTGSWDVLEKFLPVTKLRCTSKELQNLKENLRKQEDFTGKWENLKKTCQSINEMSGDEYNLLLHKFSLPNVPQEEMSKIDCIYEKASERLFFPIRGLGNFLVGYKSYCLVSQAEITTPALNIGGCIMYKNDAKKAGTNAVIVATIIDLLVLMTQNIRNMIICLPYNLQNLPQELLPTLENYNRLTLWFGNDEVSWNMTRHFAKKLDERRCYFIRPKADQPRPKLAAEMGLDIPKIIGNADRIWHESIIMFHHLREDVYSELLNIDKVQGIKWKRYPSLNRILKGHRQGELTVLTGPTGSGKTTFMSEYSLDLAMQGVNTLWGSFEIRNVRLAKTMLQQMADVPLDQNLDKFDMYADEFEKLPLFFMTFHGQQSIKVVMDAVKHATYIHDITHVIIDNVQFMIGMSDQTDRMDRFWKQDNIIAKFRDFATKCNCHVTLVMHPRKVNESEELTTSSIFGSAKASQEADNVLIIQDKRLHSIRGKKFLQIAKNRYTGDLGIMPLDFNTETLSYAQRKSKKAKSEKTPEVINNA